MRRINAALSVLLILLLVVHAVCGAFQLFGWMDGGNTVRRILTYVMLGVLALHVAIGVYLTVQTVAAARKAQRFYIRENLAFIIRRASGFAIALLIIPHVLSMTGTGGEVFRLRYYGTAQTVSNILLALSVLVHIASNVRPLLVGLGASRLRRYLADMLLVASVVLLLGAAGFIVYYFRWNAY